MKTQAEVIKNLVVLEGYPKGTKNFGGVYEIDGVYIGKSKNIHQRLKSHILSVINDSHINQDLSDHLINKIENKEKIKFKVLSFNQEDEMKFILDAILNQQTLYNITVTTTVKELTELLSKIKQ